jgi:hypothetical protein
MINSRHFALVAFRNLHFYFHTANARPVTPPRAEFRKSAMMKKAMCRGESCFSPTRKSARALDAIASMEAPAKPARICSPSVTSSAVGRSSIQSLRHRRRLPKAIRQPPSRQNLEKNSLASLNTQLKRIIELMGGDGHRVSIATKDIAERHVSEVSLMPDGIDAALNIGGIQRPH